MGPGHDARARHRRMWPIRDAFTLAPPGGSAARYALAFASRDPARAEVYRRRFGGVAAFGYYEAAAADPRVDGARRLHASPPARGARPPGRRARQGRPPREADRAHGGRGRRDPRGGPRSAGIPLMVAENFHFMPAFVAARADPAPTGAIGRVRQILVNARGYRRPAGWRRSRRTDAGGGLLIDGGVHYVHLLRDWGGPVVEVAAVAPPNLFPDARGRGHRLSARPVPGRRGRGARQLAGRAAAAPVARWPG